MKSSSLAPIPLALLLLAPACTRSGNKEVAVLDVGATAQKVSGTWRVTVTYDDVQGSDCDVVAGMTETLYANLDGVGSAVTMRDTADPLGELLSGDLVQGKLTLVDADAGIRIVIEFFDDSSFWIGALERDDPVADCELIASLVGRPMTCSSDDVETGAWELSMDQGETAILSVLREHCALHMEDGGGLAFDGVLLNGTEWMGTLRDGSFEGPFVATFDTSSTFSGTVRDGEEVIGLSGRLLPPGSGPTLSGRVLFGRERLPMSNVAVRALGTGALSTTTDSEGRYVFQDVPGGNWSIVARVDYLESKTGMPFISENRPNDDSSATWTVAGGNDVVVDDIVFPNPVFLQSGLTDNMRAWDSMGPYLRSSVQAPSFIALRMPSVDDPFHLDNDGDGSLDEDLLDGLDNDGDGLVDEDDYEGYDNDGSEVADHDQNGYRLSRYIQEFIDCEMTKWLNTQLPRIREDTYALALGDADGDGDLDLFVGNDSIGDGHPNNLHFNDGNARFVDSSCDPSAAPAPIGDGDTHAIAVADVENDGDLDVMTGVWGQDGLYLNNGTGGFEDASERLPSEAEDALALLLADFDGDQYPDAFVGLDGQNRFYTNDGAGSFDDATDQLPAFHDETLALGFTDVDLDGDLDVLAANFDSSNRLYLNDGAGVFSDGAARMPVSSQSRSIALGDLDTDGDVDALFGNSTVGHYLNLNDGTGTFTNEQGHGLFEQSVSSAIVLGDFDADGDLDLVSGGGQEVFFQNDGDAFFRRLFPNPLPQGPGGNRALVAGDLDGDSDIDIVGGFVCSKGCLPPPYKKRMYLNDGSATFSLDQQAAEGVAVDVIAHSMGGLITRAMLTNGGGEQVGKVICLDSPHGGSDPADEVFTYFPALIEWELNGFVEDCGDSMLNPDFPMYGWNLSHIESHDRDWLMYGLPKDIIVQPNCSPKGMGRPSPTLFGLPNDLDSAKCDEAWNLFRLPALRYVLDVDDCHGDIACVFPTSGTKIHWNPTRQEECTNWLAYGIPPPGASELGTSAAQLSCADYTATTQSPGGLSSSLTAAPRSDSSEVLALGSSDVRVQLVLTGEGADFLLRNGEGPLPATDLVTTKTGPRTTVRFRIEQPAPGPAELVLFAGSEAATLQAHLAFYDGKRLLAGATPIVVSAGEPSALEAFLADAEGSALTGPGHVGATITAPDSSTWSIDLFDDGLHGDRASGDGYYGNTILNTDVEGTYRIQLRAYVETSAGVVERSQHALFIVRPTGATLSGEPIAEARDLDGNGLYDALVLSQHVAFERAGRFKLVGELRDSSGQTIALPSAVIRASAGEVTTVELEVSGETLVRHGVDGPWHLANLSLHDLDLDSLGIERIPFHLLQPYRCDEFDVPAAPTITGFHPQGSALERASEVTLFGSGVADTLRVLVGGVEADFTVTGHDTLRVRLPSIRSAVEGVSDVVLETPWGTTRVDIGISRSLRGVPPKSPRGTSTSEIERRQS